MNQPYTRLLTHLVKHYPEDALLITGEEAWPYTCTRVLLKRSFILAHASFRFEDALVGWNRFGRWADQTGILMKIDGMRMHEHFWVKPDGKFSKVCSETGYVFLLPEADPDRWPALLSAMHRHRDMLSAFDSRELDGFAASVHIADIEAQPLPELDICFA